MRRTKEDAEETREKIFRAGISVFARKGYAAGTLGDVAKEAGVTRGAIYWHFKNKEAFFQETVNRLRRAYDDLVNGALKGEGDATERIVTAFTDLVRRFVHDEQFREMQELVVRTFFSHPATINEGSLPGGPDRTADHHAQLAVQTVEMAIDRNDLYNGWDATTALRAISAFISGVFLDIMEHNAQISDDEIEELANFLRRAISPVGTEDYAMTSSIKGETR